MMRSCEHGSEPSGSIKYGEFLEELRNCQLPEEILFHGVRLVGRTKGVPDRAAGRNSFILTIRTLICIKITIILQHTSCYMFRSLFARRQETHKLQLYNCVLTDDAPVATETCSSWCVVILL
jgi:hypothetical protein